MKGPYICPIDKTELKLERETLHGCGIYRCYKCRFSAELFLLEADEKK